MNDEKNSVGLELEAKTRLDEEAYKLLLQYLGLSEEQAKQQDNAYFDTADLKLDQRSTTLRVRLKKGIRELTLKEDAEGGGNLETEYKPFSNEEYAILCNEGIIPDSKVKDALLSLGTLSVLVYQGVLTTYRIEIPYKGCKLALDYSKYLGAEDWELEVERDDQNADEMQVLTDLLAELNIPYEKAMSKRKRLFARKLWLESQM